MADQTRRISRLRDLLVSIFPGLERIVDPTQKASLHLLGRYITPAEIRKAGRRRLLDHLARAGRVRRQHIEQLADATLAAAHAQDIAVPGERIAADLVRELARELAAGQRRLAALGRRTPRRARAPPCATLIRSLPGMGVTLTAEFIAQAGSIDRFATADQLAAAGLAPVLKQSGKVRYLQRAVGGNRAPKRVLFQSAFAGCSTPQAAFLYPQTRRTQTHHQAIIALARPRANVLHAMLRNREPYKLRDPKAA